MHGGTPHSARAWRTLGSLALILVAFQLGGCATFIFRGVGARADRDHDHHVAPSEVWRLEPGTRVRVDTRDGMASWGSFRGMTWEAEAYERHNAEGGPRVPLVGDTIELDSDGSVRGERRFCGFRIARYRFWCVSDSRGERLIREAHVRRVRASSDPLITVRTMRAAFRSESFRRPTRVVVVAEGQASVIRYDDLQAVRAREDTRRRRGTAIGAAIDVLATSALIGMGFYLEQELSEH